MSSQLRNRTLFFGDNLDILRKKIPDESIDLVYLDPPFNSSRDYNILFKEGTEESESQIRAFEDTWHWGEEAVEAFGELMQTTPEISSLMESLRKFVGQNDVMAYLTMMAIRMIELHRVLKPTGSLYLHCDPTAGHYLKVLLDTVFGNKNFQNEIVWRYRRWPATAKRFQRMHDTLFFYSKSRSRERPFNILYEELAESTRKQWGTKKQQAVFRDGKRAVSSTTDEESPGVPMSDVWEISILAPRSEERLGYPTQKPEKLLDRVIEASSNKGDWVLDPFCGCGTTVSVAERLGRNWVGVDITVLAINLIRKRLQRQYKGLKVSVDGIPTSVMSAEALAQKDRYQFELWANDLVGAMPSESKGADRGIDGVIVFEDADGDKSIYRRGIVQVKSGHVQRNQISTLIADVDRERADFGLFVTLEEPTGPMIKEAFQAGKFKVYYSGKECPKIQIITVRELLEGMKPDLPDTIEVYKKAKQRELEHPKLL